MLVSVVDCPNASYIPRFLDNDLLFDALTQTNEGTAKDKTLTAPGISLVVHLTPPGLFESPEYQKLVER